MAQWKEDHQSASYGNFKGYLKFEIRNMKSERAHRNVGLFYGGKIFGVKKKKPALQRAFVPRAGVEPIGFYEFIKTKFKSFIEPIICFN